MDSATRGQQVAWSDQLGREHVGIVEEPGEFPGMALVREHGGATAAGWIGVDQLRPAGSDDVLRALRGTP